MPQKPRTLNKSRTTARLKRNKSRFHSYYTTGDSIGSGTFAFIKYCTRKSDGKVFAVKIVSKHHLTQKELRGLKAEIRILKSIRYPHIIRMEDVYDDGSKVRMVLELCQGGDLFDKLLASPYRHFEEDQCARIICIVAHSLQYLHSHFIVHRDIKPENILFTIDGTLKITDFGLAHYLKLPPSLHIMHTCCGTPHYVAPEIIRGDEYGHMIDYWSLGVILYILLSGMQPFRSKSLKVMYKMIMKGQYTFPSPNWDRVSDDAMDLVRRLICVDPKQRYDANMIMKHRFITNHVDLNEFHKNEIRLIDRQKVLIKKINNTKKSKSVMAQNEEDGNLISRNKILFFSMIFLLSALSRRGMNQMYCERIKKLLGKCYKSFLSYSWAMKVFC